MPVREDGYHEILGAKIADNEDEAFWSGLFDELKERGLKGGKLVVSDGHKGIQSAVQSAFLGDAWQKRYEGCAAMSGNRGRSSSGWQDEA